MRCSVVVVMVDYVVVVVDVAHDDVGDDDKTAACRERERDEDDLTDVLMVLNETK